MATAGSEPFPRVSGRLGSQLDLNITFYKNGVPADPFAIRLVQIYKSSVQQENLIAEFPILDPDETGYPSPLTREYDANNNIKPGVFHLIWDVPTQGIPTPDIFFDVWSYIPEEPDSASDLDAVLDDETRWQRCCNEFWLLPDGFYCDSGLTNIRFGFEPIDVKFNQPEVRTLEVGLTPLPLYDFEYNKVAPIIPHLRAFITLRTENCELLVDREPMRIGLRQGTYRSNPFVLQYTFDSNRVLKGTYQYQVAVCLPNGESRVSKFFSLQVS
jgi:hypothetical protein